MIERGKSKGWKVKRESDRKRQSKTDTDTYRQTDIQTD